MVDKVKITVKAGDGGDGAVSFHREKFVARGGPDGGDGGRGGSVYLIADNNVSTLDDFKSKKVFVAQNGKPGKKLRMSGRDGEDKYIKVPVGTLVFLKNEGYKDQDMEVFDYLAGEQKLRLVADLSESGKTFLVARGGRGGKGNYRFRSSTNQTPTQYIPGEPGEEKEVILELKLIADIGIVGLPNAGKSTLINTLTHVNVKTANYPFTTLEPNLGVWQVEKGKKIIVADIPGLIEGASKGKGLGGEFLRHIERTRLLIHLVDPLYGSLDLDLDPKQVFANYQTIQRELGDYKGGLLDILSKPQIVAINKCDITEVKEEIDEILRFFREKGIEAMPISAATGEGVETLRRKVLELFDKIPEPVVEVKPAIKRFTIYNLPKISHRPILTKEVKGLIEAPKPKKHNSDAQNRKEV